MLWHNQLQNMQNYDSWWVPSIFSNQPITNLDPSVLKFSSPSRIGYFDFKSSLIEIDLLTINQILSEELYGECVRVSGESFCDFLFRK